MSKNTVTTADLVVIENAQPMTTSLKVAEVFGKNHKDVLKAIQNLECSEDFIGRNFALNEYEVKVGFGTRKAPMYFMTKDGFSFLVMGFTGSRAAEFKERYIAEFNRMEQELKKGHPALPDFSNPAAAARAWADEYEARQKLEIQLAIAQPKAEVFDAQVASRNWDNLIRFSRRLAGVNTLMIKSDLLRLGYLYQFKNEKTYRIYAKYRDVLFVEKLHPKSGKSDIYLTPKGMEEVVMLYKQGKLTMKSGFSGAYKVEVA